MADSPKIVSSESIAEPSIENYPFAGWVPTANGHLSFRHIGDSDHPTTPIYANILSNNGTRYVLAVQKRNLGDAFFGRVVERICGIQGSFWFCCAAKSSGEIGDINYVSGSIFIFKSSEDWHASAESDVKQFIESLNEIRMSHNANHGEQVENLFNKGLKTLNVTADIRIEFVLYRCGDVYFSNPIFRDTQLGKASAEYAAHRGRNFNRWVADQSYFFLRDIAHRHQHHQASSDTLLVLQERDIDAPHRWRRNIVYSLQHYIIRSKRYADGRGVSQAAGVLGYCMSFMEISKRRLIKGDFEKMPSYNDNALIQSLQSRLNEEETKLQERSNIFVKSISQRALAVAGFAVFVSFLAIFVQPKVGGNDFPDLQVFSNQIANNFFLLLKFGFLLLVVAFVFTRPAQFIEKDSLWNRVFFSRDFLELFNVRRKFWIYVFITGGIVATLATIFLLWNKIENTIRSASVADIF